MCRDCGCSVPPESPGQIVEVVQDLLAENDRVAAHNRRHFDDQGVLAINLVIVSYMAIIRISEARLIENGKT